MSETRTRQMYLPAGDWVDFWQAKPLEAPNWITVTALPERMPHTDRAEACIALVDPKQ